MVRPPLLLLVFLCTYFNPVFSGELVGEWYQEGTDDSSLIERRAFSLPITQNLSAIQATLGIQSPGKVDTVEFYLVISNQSKQASCLYSVVEIVIDSISFSVISPRDANEINGITAKSLADQDHLWQLFRSGQQLSVRVHEECKALGNSVPEYHTFLYSLKGSSAAFKFVAGPQTIQLQAPVDLISEGKDKETKSPEFAPSQTNDSNISNLIWLFIVIVLLVFGSRIIKKHNLRISRRPVSDYGRDRVEPTVSEQRQSTNSRESQVFDTQFDSGLGSDQSQNFGSIISDLPRYKVEHVIDGDTVIVSSFFSKHKIRLDSIDCPEDGQEWGTVATAGLIKIIGGRYVHLEEHGKDHYGRIIATLYVNDRKKSEWMNVNERMVTLGHAWVMRMHYKHLPKQRQDQLNKLERWAKSRRVGLWKSSNPIPPWKWRNTK